jgi:dTDP-glucose pyrophosphorylase
MNATLIIPAAGTGTEVYGREIGQSPTLALIGGKPLIRRILDSYDLANFDEIRIGVNHDDVDAVTRLCTPYVQSGAKIDVHEVLDSKSPVDTVRKLISLTSITNSILGNLGDTLCLDASEVMKFDVSSSICRVEEVSRWAIAVRAANGSLAGVLNKPSDVDPHIEPLALTGVYWWRRRDVLDRLLETATEISDLLLDSELECQLVETSLWFDGDHMDRLANAQMSTFEARSFNNIEINHKTGTLKKSSSANGDKIRSEINYLNSLPPSIAHLFPRVLESGDKPAPYYELEFYPYPNLSELYAFRPLPMFMWRRIMRKFSTELLPLMHSQELPSPGLKVELKAALVEKARLRAQETLNATGIFLTLKSDYPIINGQRVPGILALLDLSADLVRQIPSFESVIHGDLCLSNILYEPNFEILRLIDPRGGFGENSISGPSAYDVAKLAHSFLGHYDLILNDLYSVSELQYGGERCVEVQVLTQPVHHEIENAFSYEFLKLGFAQEQLELMAALLLISLVPLHLESPRRANAFLSRGLLLGCKALTTLNIQWRA